MSHRLTAGDLPPGTRFHMLTTTSEPFIPAGRRESYVRARCDCGSEIVRRVGVLKNGHTRSCGCYKLQATAGRNYRHGFSIRSDRHQLYVIWAAIVQRTTNPVNKSYANYGGRGISIWPGWQNDPAAFIGWVTDNLGSRPGLRHSLDRIDNNGNYEPGNLRWADDHAQANNRRPRRRGGQR